MKLSTLKEFFARFLRTRHIARHFRRLALLESLTGTGISREAPPALTQALVSAAISDIGAVLKQLASHSDGLSEARAEAVRKHAGLNEVEHEKPLPWWSHLWHCYKNPFSLLLTLLPPRPARLRRRPTRPSVRRTRLTPAARPTATRSISCGTASCASNCA